MAARGRAVLVQSETAADEVEDVALVGLGQPQEALAAEQARWPVVQKFLEAGDRERPVAFEGQRHETVIVEMRMMMAVAVGRRPVQVDIEDQRQRHGAARGAQQSRLGVHRADLALDAVEAFLADPVALVDQDGVGVAELAANGLAIEQVEAELLGVRHRDDGVEPQRVTELRALEGLRHRQRIGDARGLDQDMVDRLGPPQHAHDAVQKVVVGRAADAAVAELDHAAFGRDDQVVVDADVAQLVHQHRGLHTGAVRQDVVHQRGLAAAQKARHQRHRHSFGATRGGEGGGGHAAAGGAAASNR